MWVTLNEREYRDGDWNRNSYCGCLVVRGDDCSEPNNIRPSPLDWNSMRRDRYWSFDLTIPLNGFR
jgi:hypothetical protein